MADAKWLNKAVVWQRFARIPQALTDAVSEQLGKEVSEMVDAMKRAAPVSDELESHPGQFRDSIHAYSNPDRPMSYRIIADAKDDKGNFIGPHIEFGHKKRGGKGHVPAKPSFFPTYRARIKASRRRLSAAARKAIKQFTVKG